MTCIPARPAVISILVAALSLQFLEGSQSQALQSSDKQMDPDKAYVLPICEILRKTPADQRRLISIGKVAGGRGPGQLGRKEDEIIAQAITPSEAAWNQGIRIVELVFKHGAVDPKLFGATAPAYAITIKAGILEIRIPIVRNPAHKEDSSFDIEKEITRLRQLIEESNIGKTAR